MVLTEKQIFNNINRAWEESHALVSSGANWYPEAHTFAKSLADKHKIALSSCCGIISSLSPLKSWTENKKLAEQFLSGKERGHFPKQIDKARRIKRISIPDTIETILSGKKTSSFFRNIYNPNDNKYCTVDSHILKVAHKGVLVQSTPRRYKDIENAIKKISNKENLPVSTVQATIWIYAKDKFGINV